MGVTKTNAYDGPFYPNGVTISFPFTFRTMSTSEVVIVDRQGDAITGFSFSIVPAVGADGGTIVFDAPPTAAALPEFLIASAPAFGVVIDLGSVTAFNPRTLNPAFERLAVQSIFLQSRVDRAPQTPLGGGAESQFPVVKPDGSWGFSEGTGNDPAFRSDLASPAPSKGVALAAFRQAGLNARDRTARDKFLDLPLDRRDFISLQAAVNAAGASGRALYLGDEEFTQTTSVVLPDADICIFGPGSGALTITFSGSGGLFIATGLSASTNIDIGGFTARAGAADCGRPVSLEYATSSGINIRAVRLFDIIADISPDATKYWTGGPYLKNARNSVVEECYTQGAFDSLTKTLDGLKVGGEATDVKISNFQAISVGKGIDIVDQVEGTIITGFVAVDVLVGVSKVHVTTSEPWLTMTNWHINARQTGILLDNVLQTTITPGLIYCQNGSGEFIGIKVTGGAVANQDMKIAAIIDVQLGGAGMTSSCGMRIDQGNGIVADLITRDVQNPIYFGTLSYNNIITVAPNSFTKLVDGPNAATSGNRLIANQSTMGYLMPSPMGPFNPDNSATAAKVSAMFGWGCDTIGTIKSAGGMRFVSADNNWVNGVLELYARQSDSLTMIARFMGSGSPEGVVTAPVGSIYTRADGGAGSTLYVKEGGTGNTGWVAK